MFRKHKKHQKRSSFLPFVIFRTLLSLVIFTILLVGIYSAFKQFSGIDIVKINLIQRDIMRLVAGFIPSSISLPPELETLREQAEDLGNANLDGDEEDVAKPPKGNLEFRFTLVADSHNDNENLRKALLEEGEFIISLGDYTDVGTVEELKKAKSVFDGAGVRYFATAGDHDLWDSRNKGKDPLTNFNQVFGPSYQSFSYKNTRILILDNSDNYIGFSDTQLNWLKAELERINNESPQLILAFVHEPLYHPSSTRMMGKATPGLMDQAKEVTKILQEAGVAEIFSGDVHYFTRYSEPETGMPMTTIGAITAERNAQTPRYAVVSIYDDGSFEVEDVEAR